MLINKSPIRKIPLIYLLLMTLKIKPTTSFNGGNDESTVRSFETHPLIQHPAGFDVRLKCGIQGTHAQEHNNSEVFWRFKACGEGYNKSSCRSSTSAWKLLDCDGPCKATLTIKSPMENDSGLYRCSIFPYRTDNHTVLQIQIEKTYQLEVINYTITPPEFLDDMSSRNVTAPIDSQVVFQCKIHSKVPPSIKWFRKQDDGETKGNTNVGNHDEDDEYDREHRAAIKYFENTYELLESSGEMSVSEDTYLSKLILNNIDEVNVGLYVCVGINYRGFKMQEYYLSILHQETFGQEAGSKNQLFLLFLIPVCFALIPVMLYCCYKLIRRKTQNIDFHKCNYVDNSVRTDIRSRVYTRDTKYAVVNINII